MKKLLALVLAMVLLLSVAGCAQVSTDEGGANNNGYYGGYNDMMNGNNGGYESPNNDNYNDTYQDSYNNDSGNQNSSNNTNNGSSSNNSSSNSSGNSSNNSSSNSSSGSSSSSSSSSSGASSSNTAQVPEVIYEKVVEDKHHYGNKATIDKIDVSARKLFITYTLTQHYGGTYNSYATDAICYDANDNIIDILQVMYETNIETKIGSTCVDDVYIPTGTKRILINSGSKTVAYRVSKNHGNPSVTLEIPQICYDSHGYGNSVKVNSYNVSGRKIFFTYTIDSYYGGGYTSFATHMLCYNQQGAILDKIQVLYSSNVKDASIGDVYFDYTYLPEGTTKVVVMENKPTNSGSSSSGSGSSSSGSGSSSSGSGSSSSGSNQEQKGWTYSDAVKLDNYVQDACDYLDTATENCQKGSAFYAVAKMAIDGAADRIALGIALLEKNGDVTLTNGTSILETAQELYKELSVLKSVQISMDNLNQYKDQIHSLSYSGAADAALLKMLTTKLKYAF